MINKDLLKYICCPKCKTDLNFKNDFLVCEGCKNQYEIRNEIPILLNLDNLPKHLQGQIRYFTNVCTNEYKLDEWKKSYMRRFTNIFREIDNKLIVDSGTGSGYMAIELIKLGINNKVIACDLTLKNLISLKKIAESFEIANKILFVCCNAEELPFKSKIADYFISNAILEHLPKEKEAIKEIDRVCSEMGRLMVTVPLSYKFLNPLFVPIYYILDKRIGHLRRYDERILINKFSNWKLIKTYYPGHFEKVVRTLFSIIVKSCNYEKIEEKDRLKEEKKIGASNIICFFEKMGLNP